MAYTTIDDPSAHFQIALYTGNGGTLAVTNDGNSDLQPDWVWIKNRTQYQHQVYDTTRGATKKLLPSNTNDETTDTNALTAFNTDGFSVGSNVGINQNSTAHVAWQWKANGGTTSTNTTGNGIDTVVQANAAAGFSIITYTGNGTQSGQTVGHGLGAVPKMIISKDRTNSSNVVSWRVYHVGIGPTKYMELQSTAAVATYNDWDDTAPTSSVYSVGGAGGYTPTNTNNALYLAYVFAEVQGYSKISTYIGNGNADGPFVYTGFKPAWVIIKSAINSAGDNWHIMDNKRDKTFNAVVGKLFADANASENAATAIALDFVSNGFKVRATDGGLNRAADTYIFMCFAESPFTTSTAIPTTAR